MSASASGARSRASFVFLAVLSVYGITVLAGEHTRASGMVYFDQLAEAFLHGRLHLLDPSSTHDLTRHDGRWYVPFPPLPALLMLPWVGLFGVQGMNPVLFSIFWAAVGATLVHLFLEGLAMRGWTRLPLRDTYWLTVLYAFGSVQWSVAILGSVWYVSQICAVTMVALAACLAVRGAGPWWSGGALGLAMLGRPNLALAWPLLLGVFAEKTRRAEGRIDLGRWGREGLKSLVPMGLSVLALLLYNHARFGDPLDFGYRTAQVPPQLAEDLRTYGQFSFHFLWRNLEAMLLLLPRWDGLDQRLVPDLRGMSLLLTSPALIYLGRSRPKSAWTAGAWIALILLLIPLLTYYNTGWMQFGYRFSLDFMVPLLGLMSVAAGDRASWVLRALILVGVLVNTWGAAFWLTYLRAT